MQVGPRDTFEPVDQRFDIVVVLCEEGEEQENDRPPIGKPIDPRERCGHDVRSFENAHRLISSECQLFARERKHLIWREVVRSAQWQCDA